MINPTYASALLIFLLFGKLKIGPRRGRWFSYEGPLYPRHFIDFFN